MSPTAPRWPTFFIHGFLGTATSWQRVRSLVPAHPQDVALALPGHGLKPARVPELRPRFKAGIFGEVAAQLWSSVRAPRGVLVGYSLGARFALAMALSAPERVAYLILIGGNPGLEGAAARRARRRSDRAWSAMLKKDGLRAFVAAWERQPIFASQHGLPDAVKKAQRLSRLQHQNVPLAEALERFSPGIMPVWSRRIEQLACPVDWVVGANDTSYVARAQQMCQRHASSRCFLVPDAGHNVVLENPEAVAERIVAAQKKADPHTR